ncbi:hypothetical protein GHT40_04785 [Citrobacter werkmanii]|uniref:hypothetical protein n=1 Tax=Citrobacter werkmanii TaxID=67827 RepID=UPI0019008E76|nr:hypothetical protein [Citrobacter werkmanii]MBJ9293611.1 hypothetical protein [Citrobacter werkmanii]
MIIRYAVIINNYVSNIALCEEEVEWHPDEGIAVKCDDFVGIGWSYENGEFIPPYIPEPTNEEKRKKALSELGEAYQYDITKLNTSWLAAAVSDGINETAKKDAVIAQINERKEKYAQDRASIIAQYPED